MEETELKPRKRVYQSNYITQSYLPFSKLEADVFTIIVSVLKKDQREYQLNINELLNHLKIEAKNYLSLVKAINSLFEKAIIIKHERHTEKIRLLGRIKYVDEANISINDNIELEISNGIMPHLFNLKSFFTVYETQSFLQLGGTISKKLYTLFAQYKTIGSLTKTTDEIQELLGTNYKEFYVLMAKNIKPAVEEIEKITNVNKVKIQPIKRGRSIIAYKFLFNWQQPQLELPILSPSMNVKKLDIYEQLVTKYQLTNHQATIVLEHLPENEIRKTMRQVQLNKDQLRNVGAYTVSLFEKRNGLNL